MQYSIWPSQSIVLAKVGQILGHQFGNQKLLANIWNIWVQTKQALKNFSRIQVTDSLTLACQPILKSPAYAQTNTYHVANIYQETIQVTASWYYGLEQKTSTTRFLWSREAIAAVMALIFSFSDALCNIQVIQSSNHLSRIIVIFKLQLNKLLNNIVLSLLRAISPNIGDHTIVPLQ